MPIKGFKGNPAYQPTDKDRALVKALTGYGIIQEEIATLLNIHRTTLIKHYKREMETGVIEANSAVAQSLFQMATRGKNVAAAIFWLKVRAGWKDPVHLANADPDQPLRVTFRWADDEPKTIEHEPEPTVIAEGD